MPRGTPSAALGHVRPAPVENPEHSRNSDAEECVAEIRQHDGEDVGAHRAIRETKKSWSPARTCAEYFSGRTPGSAS